MYCGGILAGDVLRDVIDGRDEANQRDDDCYGAGSYASDDSAGVHHC